MARKIVLIFIMTLLNSCSTPEKVPAARDVAAVPVPATSAATPAKLDPVEVGGNLRFNGEPAMRDPLSAADGTLNPAALPKGGECTFGREPEAPIVTLLVDGKVAQSFWRGQPQMSSINEVFDSGRCHAPSKKVNCDLLHNRLPPHWSGGKPLALYIDGQQTFTFDSYAEGQSAIEMFKILRICSSHRTPLRQPMLAPHAPDAQFKYEDLLVNQAGQLDIPYLPLACTFRRVADEPILHFKFGDPTTIDFEGVQPSINDFAPLFLLGACTRDPSNCSVSAYTSTKKGLDTYHASIRIGGSDVFLFADEATARAGKKELNQIGVCSVE